MSAKKPAYNFKARPALLCLLLSFFLLTDCTVKKSIHALTEGIPAVENTNPNARRQLTLSSQSCLSSAPSILDEVDLRVTQYANPVLPSIPITLIELRVYSSKDQFFTPTLYFSKTVFLQTDTPVYLRNRTLLI